MTTDLGLKRLYTDLRTTPSLAHAGFDPTWPFTTRFRLGLRMTVTRQCWRYHSAPPIMTFPWNCLICPKSSFNSSLTSMLCNLVGSGTEEQLSMFAFMDSLWREFRSLARESSAGVVVEVLGIRLVHIANLQCGRRCMTFTSGSGRSRKYIVCGKRENPLDSIFWVIME